MAKDPAVLFYTSDFLSGTSFLNYEEKGQYITLLCQQHQSGFIPENHMINICGSLDSPVVTKFACDKKGNFYNIRMREEADKRRKYCDSRSNNKSGRPKKNIIRKSYDNHMEDEDEDEDINRDTDEFMNYFNSVLNKKLTLTDQRKNLIKKKLKEGKTLDQLKICVDNFSKDDWPDRSKYIDVVYCIGTRNNTDNFDKWIDFNEQSKKEPTSAGWKEMQGI